MKDKYVWVRIGTKRIEATGNTYPYRDIFRTMGFRWNGTFKRWERTVTTKTVEEVLRELVKALVDADAKFIIGIPDPRRISVPKEIKQIEGVKVRSTGVSIVITRI